MGSVGRMGKRSVRWSALSLPSALHCRALGWVVAAECFALLCCQMMLALTHSTHITHSTHSTHRLRYLVVGFVGSMGSYG